MSGADPARLMRFVLEMRQEGVTHARTLSAMERTPRAHYAPGHLAAMALDDMNLPIGYNQVMTKPSIVGRMVAALDPQDSDSVLEIGAGSGYQSGVMSQLANRIVTLDRRRSFVAIARAHFGTARLMRVYAHVADGLQGFPESAPYDRIIVNAGLSAIPDALIAQLKPGGVIVAPVGDDAKQRLMRFSSGESQDLGPIRLAMIEPGLPDDPKPANADEQPPTIAPASDSEPKPGP